MLVFINSSFGNYSQLLLLRVLFLFNITHLSCGLQLSPGHHVTRQNFLVTSLILPVAPTSKKEDFVEIPLTFLPRGGCLAFRVHLNDARNENRIFSYYAIVDTGSPFLTAPSGILPYSKDISRRFPPTQEQYGETVDQMEWRSVKNLEIATKDFAKPILVSRFYIGLPGSTVVDDTGGIFLGLMLRDAYRPTVLEQLGYQSFVLDYPGRVLRLSRTGLFETKELNAMEMFDFSPYGDNIHHYGVTCSSFAITTINKKLSKTTAFEAASLKRPVVAVLDSGLTGCVLSDSLRDELFQEYTLSQTLQKISGMQVTVPTMSSRTDSLTLTSSPMYWFLSSFKLPWFDDDATHPHVIALGATFLAGARITVDPESRRIHLDNQTA